MSKGDSVLCTGLTAEQANRVGVLLMAMGIEASADGAGSYTISVPAADIDAARRLLLEEFPYGLDYDDKRKARDPFADPTISAPDTWFGRGAGLVVALILVCVAVFVAGHTGPNGGSRTRLLELGAIAWNLVEGGEHWRLVAAIFLHFNVPHLFTNMATMLLVAPPLAHILGPARFLFVFVAAGVAGNIVSHELAPSIGLKAGASGAIAGVIGALGGHALRPGRETRFKSWQIFGALAAFYGLLIGFGPGRDNVAHAGGLVAGIVLGRLIQPQPQPTGPGALRAPPHPSRSG